METNNSPLISTIHRFNQFYSGILGFLDQYVSNSEFSLAEACVLHKINLMEECTSKRLARELKMDSGYLSRIIKHLEKQSLVNKNRSSEDGRSYYLCLTDAGKDSLSRLEELSNEQIYNLTHQLKEHHKKRLVKGMRMIEDALTESLPQIKTKPKPIHG